MDFAKVRKSKHQIKLNEFKDKYNAFKKKKSQAGININEQIGKVIKNQSEMISLNKNENIIKNRSFRKIKTQKEKGPFNIYGNASKQSNLDHIKKQFNLSGNIKLKNYNNSDKKPEKVKTQTNTTNTDFGFYKSKNKNKDLEITNIYNNKNKDEDKDKDKMENQPIQLMKTRSNNNSFIKKKISTFNKPNSKNITVQLYGGKNNNFIIKRSK